MTDAAPTFRPFALGALLRGAPIYEFAEFYVAKDALLKYDHRTQYLNYGWWADGEATANPSAALVARMLGHLDAAAAPRVLDVGAGLGGPSFDAARWGASAVVGVNRNPVQVHLANVAARAQGLGDRVRHVVVDATDASLVAAHGPFDAAVSVEALAEMPALDAVLAGVHGALRPGGRLVFCDIVRNRGSSLGERLRLWAATTATRVLYGDAWRTVDELSAALERAGFTVDVVDPVGDRVYGPTWAYARDRFGGLEATGRARLAATFAWANLRGLDWLYRAGAVDYAILAATRR